MSVEPQTKLTARESQPSIDSVERIPTKPLPLRVRLEIVTTANPPQSESFLKRNRTIVWFSILLIAVDFLIGQFASLWSRHSPDDYALRVEACARERRDVVFVGGSPVAEGLDPERIAGSQSSYAMGLSGGTTSDFYHAVLRGCPTPPRLLVYGITATDLNDSRNEPHGPYSLMTWGDLGRWVRLRPESGEWAVRHFTLARAGQASSLFRYRHGIRMWAAGEAEERFPGSCPETLREAEGQRARFEALQSGNGYAPAHGYSVGNYAAVKAAGLAPNELTYLAKYRTGSHLKYLHKLIDWCEAGGVELVLIDMPVTADLERFHAAAFAEYRARLVELERDRGVRVIRASREVVGLDDSHFADLIHLNRNGARKLSDWLKSAIPR